MPRLTSAGISAIRSGSKSASSQSVESPLYPLNGGRSYRCGLSLCFELPRYHAVSSMSRTRSSLGSLKRRRFSLSDLRRWIARRRGGGKIAFSVWWFGIVGLRSVLEGMAGGK